jgi:hypothetical protein
MIPIVYRVQGLPDLRVQTRAGEPEGRHLADELRATLTEAERAWALESPDLADAPDCVQWRR